MRKVAAAGIGALIVASGALATAPAMAGSNLCSANRVCIYVNADWVGLLGQRSPGGVLQNVSTPANDQMTSWENKTTTNARWYYGGDGTGDCRTMPSQRESNYVGTTDNDKLTAWATNGAC